MDTVIPVCSVCRRTRQPDGSWDWTEYHREHGNVSDTMCDECTEVLYPDLWPAIQAKRAERQGVVA